VLAPHRVIIRGRDPAFAVKENVQSVWWWQRSVIETEGTVIVTVLNDLWKNTLFGQL
jgi:hypothetical protein